MDQTNLIDTIKDLFCDYNVNEAYAYYCNDALITKIGKIVDQERPSNKTLVLQDSGVWEMHFVRNMTEKEKEVYSFILRYQWLMHDQEIPSSLRSVAVVSAFKLVKDLAFSDDSTSKIENLKGYREFMNLIRTLKSIYHVQHA